MFLLQEVRSVIISLCFIGWIYSFSSVSREISLLLEVIELESLEILWPNINLKSVSSLEFSLTTQINIKFLNFSGCFGIKLFMLVSWEKAKQS